MSGVDVALVHCPHHRFAGFALRPDISEKRVADAEVCIHDAICDAALYPVSDDILPPPDRRCRRCNPNGTRVWGLRWWPDDKLPPYTLPRWHDQSEVAITDIISRALDSMTDNLV